MNTIRQGTFVAPLSAKEKQSARKNLSRAMALVNESVRAIGICAKTFAITAQALLKVQKEDSWRVQYKNFESFKQDVCKKLGKGRTQIHQYMRVGRELGPYLRPEEIEDIGITNSLTLVKYTKEHKTLPKELITTAKTEPADALRRIVSEKSSSKEIRTEAYFTITCSFRELDMLQARFPKRDEAKKVLLAAAQ